MSCPLSSDPTSGPCVWPHAIKLCHSIGFITTLNQQRHVHRPQILDLVHMYGRTSWSCVTLFDPLQPYTSNVMSIALKSKTQYMCFTTAMKMFPSLGSIAFFGAAPCPTTSYPRSSAYAWPLPCYWQPNKTPLIIATTTSKTRPKEIQMEGNALDKVEGS